MSDIEYLPAINQKHLKKPPILKPVRAHLIITVI